VAAYEIEEFQLAPGVTGDGFVTMDAVYQEHCYLHHPGLLRRTTISGPEGWAVLTIWARHPGEPEDSSATRAWRTSIDEATYRRRVYEDLPG